MGKALPKASVAARLIETAENYARADNPLVKRASQNRMPLTGFYDDDEKFWREVFRWNSRGYTYQFVCCALSEWVARVPGLYWKPGSKERRRLSPAAVESRSSKGETYVPPGKSRKVLGGIGTLRLPCAPDGYRLASLTTTLNASAGVPALIAPEVWEHQRLKEGCVLNVTARWQEMDEKWSWRFKSVELIPPGYLVLDSEAEVFVVQEAAPVLIHPFTIMRYEKRAAELYDFVYCEDDTSDGQHRKRLTKFFASYKDRKNRYGRYLLAGDFVDPLWEPEYQSPEHLRSADPAAESHLRLLEARVCKSMLGDSTIDELLVTLPSGPYNHDDLQRLSTQIGIPWSLWFTGATLARSAAQLMAQVVEKKKIPELVDLLVVEHPEWFKQE
jgi:hypothetical protein